MFGKKYLKLPKYYRGFRAVSVIFRCGGVLYFSLTFRYFFFRSSVIQRYFFYRHETKTTKDCADRRVSLDLKILFSSRDSFHENHACTRFSHVAAVTPLQLRITMTRSHALRRHHGRLAFGFRRSARRPYGRHGREDRCCCRQPCRPGEESSGSTEIACRFTDFWLQNETRTWSWVPAAVRCASGQGLGSRFICVLCGQGAAERTHSVPPWRARQTVLGRQNEL